MGSPAASPISVVPKPPWPTMAEAWGITAACGHHFSTWMFGAKRPERAWITGVTDGDQDPDGKVGQRGRDGLVEVGEQPDPGGHRPERHVHEWVGRGRPPARERGRGAAVASIAKAFDARAARRVRILERLGHEGQGRSRSQARQPWLGSHLGERTVQMGDGALAEGGQPDGDVDVGKRGSLGREVGRELAALTNDEVGAPVALDGCDCRESGSGVDPAEDLTDDDRVGLVVRLPGQRLEDSSKLVLVSVGEGVVRVAGALDGGGERRRCCDEHVVAGPVQGVGERHEGPEVPRTRSGGHQDPHGFTLPGRKGRPVRVRPHQSEAP